MEKEKIIVIDDESVHLILLQNILEEEGYETITYTDATEALKYIYELDHCVVLLDIMMPGVDGFEILEQVKNDNKISNINIIVISAKTDFGSIKNAMDLGAFDYLTKPINIHDVKNKVRAALHKNN